ncbi:MAG: transglycosylase domain-containing protein [Paludibacteraceae bacterium]|nr:transglycosylase domain-containing protein [Paludibacteraceae bacterium]
MFKKTFSWIFWSLFLLGICSVVLIFVAINKGWIGYMPPLEELQNPKNKYASEVYSADYVVLGSYYKGANRVSVPYSEMPEDLINALVSTEDVRFYIHTGIDFKALARVLIKLGRAGGGSTLTQQLSKQLYSPTADNIFERAMQKPIEWVIATRLERLYSKEEILTMYLNQFDFLYNAVGVKQAAMVYYGKKLDELTTDECATLVGMCKNPSLYNPIRHPENALKRRNVVLSQMVKNGCLDKALKDSLAELPLQVSYHPASHTQGLAPYFRDMLRQTMTAKEPFETDYPAWNKQQYEIDRYQWDNNPLYGFCNKQKKPDGTFYNLYSDGLRIFTTIDSRMQQYAEEAVSEHIQYLQGIFDKEKKGRSYAPFSRDLTKEEISAIMNQSMKNTDRWRGMLKEGYTPQQIKDSFQVARPMTVFSYKGDIDTVLTPYDSIRYYKSFLRCGFLSLDPKTGYAKAYVGGPNFSSFQYDMVHKGRRQVGSTIKPYLFTLAMQEGMWPCDTVPYVPVTLVDANGIEWTPKESHKPDNEGEIVTLKYGLAQSSNWIAANLMGRYPPEALKKLMRDFGIQGQIDAVVALCLGPCDVSVEEMVDAYTTFPNKGIRTEPLYVTRVEDNNGNVIASFTPQTHEVISEETSYKMVHMLRQVCDHGTGVRVRFKYKLNMPMGGKTGTSQNNSDGWFMGFTPSLVSGCWVGGEDRSIHFDRMSDGQGANTALPIWALYMQKVLKDSTLGYDEQEQFDIPEYFNPDCGE